jgi:hypothetical protein
MKRSPKRPGSLSGYVRLPDLDGKEAWRRGRVAVLSSVDEVEFHVSIADTTPRGKVPDDVIADVRRAFDMLTAEEDNTYSLSRGRVRHLWLPVKS